MKKKLILISIFLVVLILVYFFPDLSKNILSGRAVQEVVDLGVVIVESWEKNVNIPASGNVTFSNPYIGRIIAEVTGLTPGGEVNISLEGSNYPVNWTEPEPNSSEAGNLKIEYFELSLSNITNGSYRVYFNVTQDKLGSVPTSNISLFIYDNGWTNLSTFVVKGTANPASFYGITTHFSKFLIGESPPSIAEEELPEEEVPPPSIPGGKGRGVAISAIPERLEEVKKIVEKPKPIHIPGKFFDVGLLIPGKYGELFAGEKVIAEINIISIQKIGTVSIGIEYYIEDMDKNIIFKEYETKAVENEITYMKEVELSADIKPGYYMFMIKVDYDSDEALAGYPFEVLEPLPPTREWPAVFAGVSFIYFILLATLMFTVIIFVVLYLLNKKMAKGAGRIVHEKIITKLKPIIKKDVSGLKRKLSLLEESYQKGYIGEEAYKKSKMKLERLLKKK